MADLDRVFRSGMQNVLLRSSAAPMASKLCHCLIEAIPAGLASPSSAAIGHSMAHSHRMTFGNVERAINLPNPPGDMNLYDPQFIFAESAPVTEKGYLVRNLAEKQGLFIEAHEPLKQLLPSDPVAHAERLRPAILLGWRGGVLGVKKLQMLSKPCPN